jgi:hypothetical protein
LRNFAFAAAIALIMQTAPTAQVTVEHFTDAYLEQKVATTTMSTLSQNYTSDEYTPSDCQYSERAGCKFSKRFSGTLTPRHTEEYTFYYGSRGGPLWVNGKQVVCKPYYSVRPTLHPPVAPHRQTPTNPLSWPPFPSV